MNIDEIERYSSGGKIIPKKIDGIQDFQTEEVSDKKGSFSEVLGDALKSVDNSRKESDTLIEGMVTGSKPVSVHETMIALEKADVAFELMNQVRRRVVRAYEEIIRTPV
jgi:flagellar hook-basal body complex protein FliE